MSGRVVALLLTFLAFFPLAASGQTQVSPAQAPALQSPVPPVSAQAAAPQASPAQTTDKLAKPEELDALVAPIALYPDSLLSLVLMASTYPLEIIQADRWIKANKNLKGDALKEAADKEPWDESVKSLLASPDVLSMMSSKLEWTLKLGDAVLAQQPDVMDAIQRLRSRADANNKLTSTKEQKITKTRAQSGRDVIAIEQTNPETLYVPYYDPAVTYGPWPYPEYPPYYFGYPGYIREPDSSPQVSRSAPVGPRALGFGEEIIGARWNQLEQQHQQHQYQSSTREPAERQQLAASAGTPSGRQIQQFERRPAFRHNNIRSAQNRMDFRGRTGNQVLRPGAGQLPAAAARTPGGRPGGTRRRTPERSNGPQDGRAPGSDRQWGDPAPGSALESTERRSTTVWRAGGGNAWQCRVWSRRKHRAPAAASYGGGGGGGGYRGGGGGGYRGGGGGGFRGGGGRGGGGGRRSDIRFKHDIVLLGHLPNGLGYYRFNYNGSDRTYVGVMAQEVQTVMPKAVVRDRDGSLRVVYERLGIKFQTYNEWVRAGAQIPAAAHASH